MRQFWWTVWFSVLAIGFLCAQPSSEKEIEASCEARKKLAETSPFKNYPVRSIGPVAPGGRVVDIDVNPKNSREFYVGLASGGVFKTENNGVTFFPVFDHQDVLTIGDFALSPHDPNVIIVGTGEKNGSRASYAGTGVYRSDDGGKLWKHIGLRGSHHISRILFHPDEPETIWVAVIGALYTSHNERGVYKTTDGGKTWKKTLFINDSTGVIDIAIDPSNPSHLLAASWERTRRAWHFKSSGVGSSIYRTTDGGETWQKSIEGFPEGAHVGRIGLSFCKASPNVVYAVVDNQREVTDKYKEKKSNELKTAAEQFNTMPKEKFLALDDRYLEELFAHRLPKRYTPAVVKSDILNDKYKPAAIADYLKLSWDMIATKVLGAEVYRSDNGGKRWTKANTYDLDGVYQSYGYYFGEIDVSPDNPDLVYLQGIPLLKSRDGGKTWHRIDTLSGSNEVHVDHHTLWIDPKDPKHLLLGNDGGLYQSYDEGASWLHLNTLPAGQFYTVNVDMEKPYNIYGGMQDNGVWKGNADGSYWKPLFSGDGMFVAADPRNTMTVYTGYHYGNYFRLEMDKKKSVKITPQHNVNEEPIRFGWRAPLILSTHNPDVLYLGANKLYRSLDRGNTWEPVSKDLTKRLPYGNVPMSTISCIGESVLRKGLLYIGMDDGNAWVTRDDGKTWQQINYGLPAHRWVSSIAPSPHDEATVFISLNGSRDDEYKAFVYMSNDFGKTWQSIRSNLPDFPVNVVVQDPVNADLLFAGLDNGTFVSLDRGTTWHAFNKFVNVSAYDMIVHPRDGDLIVASHGRCMFTANVKPLQSMIKGSMQRPVMAFTPNYINCSSYWDETKYSWEKDKHAKTEILYYIGRPAPQIKVEITNDKGQLVRTLTTSGEQGFNLLHWDVRIDDVSVQQKRTRKSPPPSLITPPRGIYNVKFINGRDFHIIPVEIK